MKPRTDQEILDQTNVLARALYSISGYQVPEGFRFEVIGNCRTRWAWTLACEAQLLLTDTDPNAAVANLEGE